MPFTFKPYEPPPLTKLRERLLQQQANRLLAHRETSIRALQDASSRLSPLELRLNAQYIENLEAASGRLRDQIELIRKQNVAEREAETSLSRQSPLERTRNRTGFFRSSTERTAAILGILERERRRSAPLTREAFSRAEAIAASRRFYDPSQSQLRGGRGYGYAPTTAEILATSSYDPCDEYRLNQKTRRQVMFAKGLAGTGYRTSHRRSPC